MGYEQIAAVDLGSNSFRMQVGRVVEDQIYPLDTLKESVRLASGLNREKMLDEASQQRGLDALSRFGERLRGFQPDAVRVVATNTLRVAKNAKEFIPQAEAALGFPIEIIGGREEARLIYIGAAHALPLARHKRLVVDIGGGSTEFIIGKKLDPLVMESLFMGCVSYSLRFFPGGKVDKKSFYEAEVSAAREIQTIAQDYRRFGWTEGVASSGSARAIADLLECNGLNPDGIIGITREGLAKLRALIIRAGSAEELKLASLRPDRLPVLPGGIAIMSAIFSELGVEHMTYSEGALRLGVLYDLLGRFHHKDMRDATVHQFMRRYQVDIPQAERVERTALDLLGQLIKVDLNEHENDIRFLRWAVALHEIGISIAHGGFHKHGAYIVSFADMPGFSKKDQERLALLLLGQRGKLEKIPLTPASDAAWRLVFCLRLAALLHRSRDDQPLPVIFVKQSGTGFQIELPADWLLANPLSAAALEDETLIWQRIGLVLRIRRHALLPVLE
ncbi:exopolyphosphatase [Propionivibrio sp.]|uniref:exopolyphosphatase n=1 Tax=Propionivibrio sp. TaxID=2212460 RepID=UPI003BF0FEAB